MKKVVIIGGGFGGLACAHVLRGCPSLQVTLLDLKPSCDFLPLLPDIVGGRISADAARVPLASWATDEGFVFIHDEVTRVDRDQRRVYARKEVYEYDYLVIAAGTQTNFYGNTTFANLALKLDDVTDAERIVSAVEKTPFDTVVVAGGGYTGVEIATNLRRRLDQLHRTQRIVIIETAGEVVPVLPEWMKQYVKNNLAHLNVEVLANCRVQTAQDARVVLSNGSTFESALLIWSAGVQTPAFVRDLGATQTPQGRLAVDEFLQISEGVFSIGDTAAVTFDGRPLRMAVQFSLAQGWATGENLLRHQRGESFRRYRPSDLGYIVPMSNFRGCGEVLGKRVHGWPAAFLHYAMSVFRSVGNRQRIRILKDLL